MQVKAGGKFYFTRGSFLSILMRYFSSGPYLKNESIASIYFLSRDFLGEII